ncbi:MAG: DUF222 domain-containing protein [Acidimicrobiia bacterium]
MLFTDPDLVTDFKTELAENSAEIARLEARRLTLLNQLQRAGAAEAGGARTMVDWTATTLDVTHRHAQQLVAAANNLCRKDPYLFEQLEDGEISFDRAMTTLTLMGADAPMGVVDLSLDLDLAAVNRLINQYRRITHKDEQQAFNDRHFSIQPTLDNSMWRGSLELPAVEGSIVDQAIAAKADELRQLPGGDHYTRSQLNADALVMISQDSLTNNEEATSGGVAATVFVDLDRANGTGGELGVELQYGPRVGPNVLDEVLCGGTVRVVGLEDGQPVVTSHAASAIPPAMRDFVAWRDKGCVVKGCHSRYRLQIHHIKHRAHHGDHDPSNLAVLCWFHHHIAIHQTGFSIDVSDPPSCRRLIPPGHGSDPP